MTLSWTAPAIAVIALAFTPASGLAQSGPAPIRDAGKPGAVKERYIVVLKAGEGDASINRTRKAATDRGGNVHRSYTNALRGFAATLPDAALAEVRKDSAVAYVEPDAVMSTTATQSGAPYNLDRIDQRNLPLNGTYTYTPTGAGVSAYVIDTGIRATHQQFGGRAVSGFDAIDGGAADDCNGHGTHVAGTIGGSTYGVAKLANLVAVRVLDCKGSGLTSGVIAGVDYVTSVHQAGQPAVANMSLGGSTSSSLDQAVQNSIADGVSYAVAAGNENTNACNSSPARAANAITVGSTTSSDARSSFSNYGSCLDVFAPGSSVKSAWHTSTSATATLSGTSMATPHAAGVAALYLQGNPSAAPSAVAGAITSGATTGVVTNPGSGSPNRLLFSPLASTSAPPPLPPPPGCQLAQSFNGSLQGTNDSNVQPNGTYYRSATSGAHKGCLRGPLGTDFDLSLYKWNGSTWTRVAVAQSASSDEDITYNGTAGYYYWRVSSYSGSGSYTFGLTRPS